MKETTADNESQTLKNFGNRCKGPLLYQLRHAGTTITTIAFRYCPELALDIWSMSFVYLTDAPEGFPDQGGLPGSIGSLHVRFASLDLMQMLQAIVASVNIKTSSNIPRHCLNTTFTQ